MKNLKIVPLLFLALFFVKCGKDKTVTPENKLDYPLSFVIDHYNMDDLTKFYVEGENNTYSEITVQDSYKASFDAQLVEGTDETLKFFDVRKLVLKSAVELDVTFVDIDPNTLEVKSDTVVSYPITMEGNKVNVPSLRTFFLSDDNKSLLLPQRAYKSSYYNIGYVDNLDKDFSSIADIAAVEVAAQDTFGVKFFDLVYKEE